MRRPTKTKMNWFGIWSFPWVFVVADIIRYQLTGAPGLVAVPAIIAIGAVLIFGELKRFAMAASIGYFSVLLFDGYIVPHVFAPSSLLARIVIMLVIGTITSVVAGISFLGNKR